MSAFEAEPAKARGFSGVRVSAAVSLLALSLAGCATTQNYATAEAPHAATRVAAAVVEMEDDGMPAQAPPPSSIRQEPDDPSEPWSRNYGGSNPSVGAHIPREDNDHEPIRKPAPVRPDVPDDLPPAFRKQLVSVMTDED
jgi:hypothetical protein